MAAGYELGVLGVQCSATELYQGSVRPTACSFHFGGKCKWHLLIQVKMLKNFRLPSNMSNVIMLSCI